MVASSASNSLLLRRLYRSLIKASRPFDERSNRGSALACLIHRTGNEDRKRVKDILRAALPEPLVLVEDVDDDDDSSHQLFRKLLREFVSGGSASGLRQMQFPLHQDDNDDASVARSSRGRMANMIRREFKCPEASNKSKISTSDEDEEQPLGSDYSLETRREVAFMALRELNKKLAWSNRLEPLEPHEHQAARFVTPLPLHPPEAYLQPGTYLISHPHLTDYFRRTVICLLHHEDNDESNKSGPRGYRGTYPSSASFGTYGLIINRFCESQESGRNLRLEDIVQPLPSDMAAAFGSSTVREGGPVHMALQMMHSSPATASSEAEESNNPVGGTILPMATVPDSALTNNKNDDDEETDGDVDVAECSTALHSDRGVYYKGDLAKASDAVMNGKIDREDVSFFVGASCWQPGQLEREIEGGFWLPCRGPPEIALTGICEHEPTEKGKPRPKADLWLSMLSACGEKESELAHLVWSDDGDDECSGPCDYFNESKP